MWRMQQFFEDMFGFRWAENMSVWCSVATLACYNNFETFNVYKKAVWGVCRHEDLMNGYAQQRTKKHYNNYTPIMKQKGVENDIQGDVDICEYDSNTLQQKPLFELHGIGNLILKGRQKNVIQFVNYKSM